MLSNTQRMLCGMSEMILFLRVDDSVALDRTAQAPEVSK